MTVFVSYSRRDEKLVRRLLSAFRHAQEEVLYDRELPGGELWWQKILEQIRRCDVFVFALSQNSLDSRPCIAELRYAEALGKPVLPVQVGKVIAERTGPFAATNYIDYRNPDADSASQLMSNLYRCAANKRPLPTPLPPEPPMPFLFLMRMQEGISGPQDIPPPEQMQMLAELKSRLNEEAGDASARADIGRLLWQLRDRADATPVTRAAVDKMLDELDLKRADALRVSRKWLLRGGAALLVVVVGGFVGFVIFHRGLVTTEELPGVLLPVEQINAVMGTDMTGREPVDRTEEKPGDFKPPVCIGAFYNNNIAVYKDTGYSDTRTQALRHPPAAPPGAPRADADAVVYQTAILFPDPQRARKVVRDSAQDWKTCSSEQPVKITEADQTSSIWKFAPMIDKDSVIVQTATMQEPQKDYICQHVLRDKSNLVIEVHVCRSNKPLDNESIKIADQMAAKVGELTRLL